MTALDEAHAAMEAAPGEDAPRLRFYERVADAELTVLLEREATGDRIAPRVFEVEGAGYVLAFDLPDRGDGFHRRRQSGHGDHPRHREQSAPLRLFRPG